MWYSGREGRVGSAGASTWLWVRCPGSCSSAPGVRPRLVQEEVAVIASRTGQGLLTCLLSVLTLSACKTGGEHLDSLQSAEDRSLTAGEVQRNIRIGMSGAEVIAALGSPNIVTTDQERREAWVYDRVATERAYSTSEGGLFLIFGAVSGQTGASKTSQKTLTVIIKFDEQGKVRDYAYHSSRF